MTEYSDRALEKYLQDNVADKKVALIGNGPISGNQGQVIDVHDVVMRFNNLGQFTENPKLGKRFTHWVNNRDQTRDTRIVEIAREHDVPVLLITNPDNDGKTQRSLQFYRDNKFTVFYREGDFDTPLENARGRTGFMMAVILKKMNIECNAFGFTPTGSTRGHHDPPSEHSLLLTFSTVVVVPTDSNPGEDQWPVLKFDLK